jgi:hypothetical protein
MTAFSYILYEEGENQRYALFFSPEKIAPVYQRIIDVRRTRYGPRDLTRLSYI